MDVKPYRSPRSGVGMALAACTLVAAFLAALIALLVGCQRAETTEPAPVQETAVVEDGIRASNVNYVCVGMETSARFGSCPGCKLDSDRMNRFLYDTFGYGGVLLQSERATRTAVVEALKNGLDRTPEDGLFIFYYSGHGGQERLQNMNTSEPEGADAADEYLCLYDSYLLDDEIWKLVTSCRGRVFLCFDACHSQTMYRSVKPDYAGINGLALPLSANATQVKSSGGFRLKPKAVPLSARGLRMLCWSGCCEAEYSYGSSSGGVMTNAILRRWTAGVSYDDLWGMTVSDVRRYQPTQHPCATHLGGVFTEAFK